jgi:translation elongation factor P/translation initiation factor 5A
MVQAKLKNIRTGAGFEHRFRADDSVERASMETHDLEFLYQGGDTYHFMNVENYDQLEMDEETLGDNAQWMVPNMRLQAEFYDGRRSASRFRSADVRDRRHVAGDEDGDQDVIVQAGEARERRDDSGTGIHSVGCSRPGESEHWRVPGSREGLSGWRWLNEPGGRLKIQTFPAGAVSIEFSALSNTW